MTIIQDQIKLVQISANSAKWATKLTYRKGRYDWNTRFIPFMKDYVIPTVIAATVIAVVAIVFTAFKLANLIEKGHKSYARYHQIERFENPYQGTDRDLDSVESSDDPLDPASESVDQFTEILEVIKAEQQADIKIITDDMLMSKAGKPLTGGAKKARINKLVKEGYTLV